METPAVGPIGVPFGVRNINKDRRDGGEQAPFERSLAGGQKDEDAEAAENGTVEEAPVRPTLQKQAPVFRRDEDNGMVHVDVLA